MNRILLQSTVVISLAVIQARQGGMKPTDIQSLSLVAQWCKLGRPASPKAEQHLVSEAKRANLTKEQTALIVGTFGLTYSQINYSWKKHLRQTKRINLQKVSIVTNADIVQKVLGSW